MILDGYGLRDEKKGNGIAEANTPVMDKLMAEYPFVKGNASGPDHRPRPSIRLSGHILMADRGKTPKKH